MLADFLRGGRNVLPPAPPPAMGNPAIQPFAKPRVAPVLPPMTPVAPPPVAPLPSQPLTPVQIEQMAAKGRGPQVNPGPPTSGTGGPTGAGASNFFGLGGNMGGDSNGMMQAIMRLFGSGMM